MVDYLTEFVWGGLTAGGVSGLDATAAFGASDTTGHAEAEGVGGTTTSK